LLHPASHGTVEALSDDPLKPPKIDGHYLNEPEDIERMLKGIEIAITLANAPAMQEFIADKQSPIPSDRKSRIEWIRQTAVTAHHPCGTCRMGPENSAPLDIDLRLRGVDNMLIVDASVFPKTISGNINACVYMLAEKTAAMLTSPARGLENVRRVETD
jgi:choline dehydrogenase-like flavoprotein